MNLSVSLAALWIGNAWQSGLNNGSQYAAINHDDVTPPMTTVLTSETAEQLQLLSEEQRVRAESILLLIRYAIFALALPAIVCNVVVFAQREMRGAISVYVIGLSVGRLVYIVVSVVGTVMREAVDVDHGDSYACYLLYSVYVAPYLCMTVRQASHLVMCFASLERLRAVFRPFHVKEFVLSRHTLVVTVLIYVFSAICHVYVLTRSPLASVPRPGTGNNNQYATDVSRPTHTYEDNPDITETNDFGPAASVLITYIPLLGLAVLNHNHNHNHNLHGGDSAHQHVQPSTSGDEDERRRSRRQREKRMTLTILTVTVSYLVLSLPHYAAHHLASGDPALGSSYYRRKYWRNLLLVVRSCAHNVTLLSCAVDFFCFVGSSSSFRKTLLRLAGRDRRQGGFLNQRQEAGVGVGVGEGSSFCQTIAAVAGEADAKY